MYKIPSPTKNRNGTYYLRFNIPKELQPLTSKTCIKRSLGTKNKAEAYRNSQHVWNEILDELNAIKNSQKPSDMLTDFQIDSICALWYDSIVSQLLVDSTGLQLWAFERVGFPFKEERELIGVRFFWNSLLDDSSEFEAALEEEFLSHVKYPSNGFSSNLLYKHFLKKEVTREVRHQLIKEHGLTVQPGSNLEMRLSERLLVYFCKLKQYSFEALRGAKPEVEPVKDKSQKAKVVAMLHKQEDAVKAWSETDTISAIELRYFADLRRTDSTRRAESRIKDYTPSYRKLKQYVGDISLGDISVYDIRSFRDLLYESPASQAKVIKNMPLNKQVEYAKANGLNTLSANTVRNHIVHISSLFEYAVKNGYVEKNVAKGLVPSQVKKKRVVDLDGNLSEREVKLIFSQPVFTERDFRQFRGWKTIPNEAFYWVPLLCYHFGTRVAEVAERYTNQVFKYKDSDIYILRIDESAGVGTVKELGSARDLPIPDTLVKLGFINYVQSLPQNSPIFPRPGTTEPMSVGSFRKAFKAYLDSIEGFELNGRKPTHCFRHTMETTLRDLEVGADIRNYITGRERSGSSEVYGSFMKSVTKVLDKIPPPFTT